MSATYKMRIGDDVREMVVTLSRTGSEDWQEPTEAVLKIKPRYGSLVEKTLERGDEDIDGQWVYQWKRRFTRRSTTVCTRRSRLKISL
jgi:hypothetical protein